MTNFKAPPTTLAIHSAVPTIYLATPAVHVTTSAVHAVASAVYSSAFRGSFGIPAVHAVAPTVHAAVPTIHSAVPTIRSAAPVVHTVKYSSVDFNNPNHIILWYYNDVDIFTEGARNMKKTWIIVLAIILLIVALPIISVAGSYNKLVVMDETIDADWKQVENLMQRRYDLVPNLVEVAKGYAIHEKEIFTEIADARARIGQGSNREEVIGANQELTGALSRLLVIAENYPDLKANEQFIRLQDELAGTENRLAVARQDYNGSVQTYNQTIRRFPTNIIAGMLRFEQQPYFEMEQGAGKAPSVKFD